MMPLLNYTTTVAPGKTANQIVDILARKGARNILLDYDGRAKIQGIKWRIESPHGPLSFALPVNVEAVYQVMTRDHILVNDAARRREQSERVAWRILKDWVEAQMALLETGMVQMEEIFLPYMLSGGQTLYQALASRGFTALQPGVPEMEV